MCQLISASSRSSFLELIGLRRKREKMPPVPSTQGDLSYGFAKAISAKKRKRKISGNDSCNPLCNGMRNGYQQPSDALFN
jgi:hypothetical protein